MRRIVDVPLREVSGICLRRCRRRQMSLIAVGDKAADGFRANRDAHLIVHTCETQNHSRMSAVVAAAKAMQP